MTLLCSTKYQCVPALSSIAFLPFELVFNAIVTSSSSVITYPLHHYLIACRCGYHMGFTRIVWRCLFKLWSISGSCSLIAFLHICRSSSIPPPSLPINPRDCIPKSPLRMRYVLLSLAGLLLMLWTLMTFIKENIYAHISLAKDMGFAIIRSKPGLYDQYVFVGNSLKISKGKISFVQDVSLDRYAVEGI